MSNLPGQLDLVSSPRSTLLNALANALLAPYLPKAQINLPALPSPILNPIPSHFPLFPSPPQALSLHAQIPVATNVNPSTLSPSAQSISSANVFVPHLVHPPPPQKLCQPQNFVPIIHAALRFVGTSVNVNSLQTAPLSNLKVPTSLRSSFHVQAAAGSQNYVTSEFMQANPFSSSTGTAPPLSFRSFRQRTGLPF